MRWQFPMAGLNTGRDITAWPSSMEQWMCSWWESCGTEAIFREVKIHIMSLACLTIFFLPSKKFSQLRERRNHPDMTQPSTSTLGVPVGEQLRSSRALWAALPRKWAHRTWIVPPQPLTCPPAFSCCLHWKQSLLLWWVCMYVLVPSHRLHLSHTYTY